MSIVCVVILAVLVPFTRLLPALLVDGLATIAAAIYWARAQRLSKIMLTPNSSRRARRLSAKHLQLSIMMTAHYSLFPRSAGRGYRLAGRLSLGR